MRPHWEEEKMGSLVCTAISACPVCTEMKQAPMSLRRSWHRGTKIQVVHHLSDQRITAQSARAVNYFAHWIERRQTELLIWLNQSLKLFKELYYMWSFITEYRNTFFFFFSHFCIFKKNSFKSAKQFTLSPNKVTISTPPHLFLIFF